MKSKKLLPILLITPIIANSFAMVGCTFKRAKTQEVELCVALNCINSIKKDANKQIVGTFEFQWDEIPYDTKVQVALNQNNNNERLQIIQYSEVDELGKMTVEVGFVNRQIKSNVTSSFDLNFA